MFAPLLGAIRADIDRQVGWAKDEIRRQTRYATLTGVLAGVAALAALGAIVTKTNSQSRGLCRFPGVKESYAASQQARCDSFR